jgi:hypothetical protein
MSLLIPSVEHVGSKGIVLGHWIPMINTLPFELRFEWFTVCRDGPHILRPSVPLLYAEEAFPQSGPQQFHCGRPRVNRYKVAQGLAGAGSAGRVQAKVARIPFVLRIPAVACLSRKVLNQVSLAIQVCVRAKASFWIEGFSFSHGQVWRAANTYRSYSTGLLSGYRAHSASAEPGIAER